MTKLMNRKLNKKGFTLAELLIVVAIIAILVAIAAPLFVGALDEANESVRKANIRAVKSAAIAEILLHPEKYGVISNTDGGTTNDSWLAKANVSSNGDISWVGGSANAAITAQDSGADKCERQDNGGYYVEVFITDLDLSD